MAQSAARNDSIDITPLKVIGQHFFERGQMNKIKLHRRNLSVWNAFLYCVLISGQKASPDLINEYCHDAEQEQPTSGCGAQQVKANQYWWFQGSCSNPEMHLMEIVISVYGVRCWLPAVDAVLR